MSSRRSRRHKASGRAVTAAAQDSPISKIAESMQPSNPSVVAGRKVQQVVSQQTHFQGPLPHPEIFAKYGDVISNAPERILRVFEDDSLHAREIQKAALEAQKSDNRRVHWMAWSLIAGGYLLSGLFAWAGKDWLAGLILTGTLAGTITGFLQNRRPEGK